MMRLCAGASVVALILAGPAAAQINADDVWAQWERALGEVGEVSWASVESANGVVQITDLSLALLGSERFVVTVPALILSETPTGLDAVIPQNGTVLVTDRRDEDVVYVSAQAIMAGAEMSVTEGTPDAYRFAIPQLGVADVMINDASVPFGGTPRLVSIDAAGTWDTLAGNFSFDPDAEIASLRAGFQSGPLTIDVDFEIPGEIEVFQYAATMQEITLAAAVEGPLNGIFAGQDDTITWDVMFDMGATSSNMNLRAVPDSEGDVPFALAWSTALDGISISSDATMPLNLEQSIMNVMGVPEGMQGRHAFNLRGLTGAFDFREITTWYGYNVVTTRGRLDETNIETVFSLSEEQDFDVFVSARTGFDFEYADELDDDGYTYTERVDYSVAEQMGLVDVSIPLGDIAFNPMSVLDSLRYTLSSGVTDLSFEYETREVEAGEVLFEEQVVVDLPSASAGFAWENNAVVMQAAISSLDVRGAENGTSGAGTLRDFTLRGETPVLTEGSGAPYSAALQLGQLSLDAGAWSLVDPTGAFEHDDMSADIRVDGLLSTNPLVMLSMGAGAVPYDLKNVDFDVNLQWLGLGVVGAGSFETADVINFGGYPVGSGGLVFDGLQRFLDATHSIGGLTDGEYSDAQFYVNAFTVPGDADGRRTMDVEFTPDAHVIVNGLRMQ